MMSLPWTACVIDTREDFVNSCPGWVFTIAPENGQAGARTVTMGAFLETIETGGHLTTLARDHFCSLAVEPRHPTRYHFAAGTPGCLAAFLDKAVSCGAIRPHPAGKAKEVLELTLAKRRPIRSRIMGVLNLTSDSFYDGGNYLAIDAALERVLTMVEEGADIIDLGAESSRPGARPVSADDEAARLLPVLRQVRKAAPTAISVDTYKPEVAVQVLEEGAQYINDIYGLRDDSALPAIIARHQAGVVIMHMQGTPATMQTAPKYRCLPLEIASFLAEGVSKALTAGIDADRIFVDPGIGFGKTVPDNLWLIRHPEFLTGCGAAGVLYGPSRKSFIGAVVRREAPGRLAGTAAVAALLSWYGCDVIRVHDTADILDVVLMMTALDSGGAAREDGV
ncbi:dihydropteroate synthase [bacterium]|nr:dihydropteroate synthase [candidate division CSSED10-310 bacterium]